MKLRFRKLFSWKILSAAGVVLLAGIATGASFMKLSQPLTSYLLAPRPDVSKKKISPSKPRLPEPDPGPANIEVLPDGPWVDSVLTSLTLDEKIGQFFMVSAYSNRKEAEYKNIENLIRQHHLGGVLFFQGGPARQAALTNRYQAAAKVPLLVGLDAEWGLGMRLDSTISYPRQLTLGAIRDNDLIYDMGSEIGRQLARIGVNVNFAPVADINTNPRNPVIGNRSFGDDRVNVSEKASAYMKGLQHRGVIAVAKHFPGHGDTETDSHHTLPVLNHPGSRLSETELYPFRKLIRDSLTAVMSGHLHVPALDTNAAVPASLSEVILGELLREKIGFKGLIFTDAMNMKGVAKSGKPSEINLKALLAGNDIILAPEGIAESVKAVKDAVADGRLSEALVDEKVRRILRAKYFAGLHSYQPVDLHGLKKDINSSKAEGLKRELIEASVAVIRNDDNLLPFASKQLVASISVGDGNGTAFQKMMSRFGDVRHFNYYKALKDQQEFKSILRGVEEYSTVVMALHNVSGVRSRDFNIPVDALHLLDTLRQMGKKTVVCVFGNPYSLEIIPESDAMIAVSQNDDYAQGAVVQALYGTMRTGGMLAINVGVHKRGVGFRIGALNKLAYSAPDLIGLNGDVLSGIDYLAQEGISKNAFPGCQVLVAHAGKIVFEKSYGTLKYDSNEKVSPETLYDLASVTKVVSTVQALMLLYDRNKLDIGAKASLYLPELKGTDKKDITIRELLVHQAGLKSFYPKLWESTMLSPTELSGAYYSNKADSLYSMQVAPTLYTKKAVQDSVWKWITESPMAKKGKTGEYPYVYSDLGFIVLQKVVERVSGMKLDEFVRKNLYEPMGIKNLGYNPLERFDASRIAPTENDGRYRGELLQGTVHDQMAALYGGVAGHAGLFGNAYDLAVLLQMNLWNGSYGGKRYIKEETITLFTKKQGGQRGLGWNKPKVAGSSSFLSELSTPGSYGHTGFTGNVVWVDPEKDLIFIFLSNRVHPSPNNNRINTLKIRKRIHDVAYEALLRNEAI